MTKIDKKIEEYLSDEFNEGLLATAAKAVKKVAKAKVGVKGVAIAATAGVAVGGTTQFRMSLNAVDRQVASLQSQKSKATSPERKESIQNQIDALHKRKEGMRKTGK